MVAYLTVSVVTAVSGAGIVGCTMFAWYRPRGRMWYITLAIVCAAVFIGCLFGIREVYKKEVSQNVGENYTARLYSCRGNRFDRIRLANVSW